MKTSFSQKRNIYKYRYSTSVMWRCKVRAFYTLTNKTITNLASHSQYQEDEDPRGLSSHSQYQEDEDPRGLSSHSQYQEDEDPRGLSSHSQYQEDEDPRGLSSHSQYQEDEDPRGLSSVHFGKQFGPKSQFGYSQSLRSWTF
ncbi:hypothetical protein STEG23_032082 [Scotinomys teguina]